MTPLTTLESFIDQCSDDEYNSLHRILVNLFHFLISIESSKKLLMLYAAQAYLEG
jgi:hypothetical protein